jgi:hypothetical protein
MMRFTEACSFVGIYPTKRQEKKWQSRRGIAYRAASGHCTIPEDEVDNESRFALAKGQLASAGRYDP